VNHALLNAGVEIAAERMLHSIVIGLAMAVCAWALPRILSRANPATRFAVWFTALLITAILSVVGTRQPLVTLPSAISRPLLSFPGSWAWYFALGWAALSGVGLLRVAVGWVELRQLRKSCRAIPLAAMQWRTMIANACPSRSVSIVTTDRVRVPTAVGFVKPIVVLPSTLLEQLTPAEISQVLLHELAHLRRWDDWTNAVQKVIKALLIFHPAVWWMEEQVSLEREMACDDAVVSATSSPRAYAECLVSLAEKSCARRSAALVQAAVNRLRHTTLRVARILHEKRAQGPVRYSAVLVVSAFACTCIGIATQLPQIVSFASENPTVVAKVHQTSAVATPSSSPTSFKPILAATRIPVSANARPAVRRSTPIIHHPQRPLRAANRFDVAPPFIVPAKSEFDMRATFKTGVVIIYVSDPVFGPTPLMFHFAVWEFVPAQSAQGVTQRNI
jgi:Zn-dependent protease with chaperone function